MSMWLRQEVQALRRSAGRRLALSWTAKIALLPVISIQAHSFGCFNFLTIRVGLELGNACASHKFESLHGMRGAFVGRLCEDQARVAAFVQRPPKRLQLELIEDRAALRRMANCCRSFEIA